MCQARTQQGSVLRGKHSKCALAGMPQRQRGQQRKVWLLTRWSGRGTAPAAGSFSLFLRQSHPAAALQDTAEQGADGIVLITAAHCRHTVRMALALALRCKEAPKSCLPAWPPGSRYRILLDGNLPAMMGSANSLSHSPLGISSGSHQLTIAHLQACRQNEGGGQAHTPALHMPIAARSAGKQQACSGSEAKCVSHLRQVVLQRVACQRQPPPGGQGLQRPADLGLQGGKRMQQALCEAQSATPDAINKHGHRAAHCGGSSLAALPSHF